MDLESSDGEDILSNHRQLDVRPVKEVRVVRAQVVDICTLKVTTFIVAARIKNMFQ